MAQQATPHTLITDPIHGDVVTLAQLAERHNLSQMAISKRYNRGIRDERLVESIKEREARASREGDKRRRNGTARKKGPVQKVTARELADNVLATREGRLASRLLKHYAA